MSIKIGICIRFKNPTPWSRPWARVYQEHLEYGRAAERLGFDGIWVPEHHCVESGYNPAPFLALTALAGVTERCWLGTQPLLLPLHNPVLVAEEAAVLDVLSGGRLILGVGAGYRPGDFAALGERRNERGARMEEGVELLIKALSGRQPLDFSGTHYRVKGVDVHPRPVQTPHPEIQLSVRSRAAARRAGRFGLSVNLLGIEGVRSYGPLVAEARGQCGFGATEAGASVLCSGFLDETPEAARAAVRDYLAWDAREYDAWQGEDSDPDDRRMVQARLEGGAAPTGLYDAHAWLQAVEQNVAEMRRAGLKPDWVNVTLWPPGMPLQQALEALERFAVQVLPGITERNS